MGDQISQEQWEPEGRDVQISVCYGDIGYGWKSHHKGGSQGYKYPSEEEENGQVFF